MRVLLISHNVISETNNMGKTLLSYFKDFSPNELAEFYIQEKEPRNAEVCTSFYQFTDRDALRSIMGKRAGTEYNLDKSSPETVTAKSGAIESIRQYGRKRNAFVYIARNAVWAVAHWRTDKLVSWLNRFDPDLIFFMAGDFGFMYKITLAIQTLLNKPLVVCCVDDYFLNNRNKKSWMGRYQHRAYMKTVSKVMNQASCILTISDSMRKAYHELFNKPCFTLHTSAKRRCVSNQTQRNRIAYFGNLGLQRSAPLVDMGKVVNRLGIDGLDRIDVYSGEKNPDNLAELIEENGICFHGEIPASEVAKKMDECMAIIHTESFNPEIKSLIKYSVSTKIAESLMYGPCLIAYGPDGIASIDYLKENNAAYVITSPNDLDSSLKEILTNAALRAEIVKNARELAAKNHDEAINPKKVRQWLQMAIDSYESN